LVAIFVARKKSCRTIVRNDRYFPVEIRKSEVLRIKF